MKILFFDMEFANGKIPGSIYSFGYVETNGKFRLIQPQTDVLMNPECNFNDYVRTHILAYPMETVRQASTFPAYYKRLKKLLCRANLVVGFAANNDTAALLHGCERYGLKPPVFQCLDMERVCKKYPDHREARGLSGCVEAWCGKIPEHQHRSDGDAYATMLLFRAVCEAKGIAPKTAAKVFADCMIPSVPPEPKKTKEGEAAPGANTENAEKRPGTGKRRRRRRRRPAGQTANGHPSAANGQDRSPRPTQNGSAQAASQPNGTGNGTAKRHRRRRPHRPAQPGSPAQSANAPQAERAEKPQTGAPAV